MRKGLVELIGISEMTMDGVENDKFAISKETTMNSIYGLAPE